MRPLRPINHGASTTVEVNTNPRAIMTTSLALTIPWRFSRLSYASIFETIEMLLVVLAAM